MGSDLLSDAVQALADGGAMADANATADTNSSLTSDTNKSNEGRQAEGHTDSGSGNPGGSDVSGSEANANSEPANEGSTAASSGEATAGDGVDTGANQDSAASQAAETKSTSNFGFKEEGKPSTEGSPEAPKVDHSTYIKDNGYVSKDEAQALRNKIAEFEANTQEPITDDFVNAIIAKHRAGEKVDMNYLKRQSVDYDTLDTENIEDAKDLVAMKMSIKDGISIDEAKFKVGREYRELRDLDPEDEDYIDSKKALGFASKEAKGFLVENQKNDRLPKPGSAKDTSSREKGEADKATWRTNWSAGIPDEISKASTLDVNGTDYTLSPEDKKDIEVTLKARIVEGLDTTYTGRYFDRDSRTWDVQKMIADEAWKDEGIRGRMLSKVAGNSRAAGSREVAENVKNTDFTTKGKPSSGESSITQKESDAWDKVASGLGL
jgi:hypothetical protein